MRDSTRKKRKINKQLSQIIERQTDAREAQAESKEEKGIEKENERKLRCFHFPKIMKYIIMKRLVITIMHSVDSIRIKVHFSSPLRDYFASIFLLSFLL